MKGFIFGLILGILVVPTCAYLYIRGGYMPVATTAKPLPMEEALAHEAMHKTAEKEAPKTVPLPANEATFVAGAHVYVVNCAFCHGLPNQPENSITKGMYPHPPQLFTNDDMVTDDPAGVTFWKARNGIRLTGMPGFASALTDEQMWQVSLLLANADKLPPTVSQALVPPPIDRVPAK
ncbi:MAG: c-type cytochrome [Candidatus Acidiferrales bacterium]